MNQYEEITMILRKYENVLIMTHKNPDLDGFASALVFNQILNHLNIKNKIYLNDNELDTSIKKSLFKLENKDYFIIEEDAKKEKFDLLIVVDTNKPEILENEEFLNTINDVIVIDHHIKGHSYIKTIYEILDSKTSSTAELIINYIKKLNIKLDILIYTMLLAGMEIDTNGFSVKISSDSFHAAAYLLEQGADPVLKQELLKENRDEYVKKQYFIKRGFVYDDNIMISMLDENIYDKKYLATISEELLQFEGIEASFTIGNVDDNIVGISARSVGNIDVESIVSKLNGGGHKTNAATQIINITKEDAKHQLLEILGGK